MKDKIAISEHVELAGWVTFLKKEEWVRKRKQKVGLQAHSASVTCTDNT